MPSNLSSYKVGSNESSSSTKFDNLVQAAQDALNAIGDTSKMSWAAGAILDPNQLKQAGATSGQVIMWNGTIWVPTSAPGSAFSLISDSTLGSDGTFSFTSIPSTFKHLRLVCYLRTDRANTEDSLGLRFNNDTGSNYDGYTFKMSGTTPSTAGAESLAATFLTLTNAVTGNSATANVFGVVTITIPHYANAINNKVIEALAAKKVGTSTGNLHTLTCFGGWRANTAINRVDLAPTVGTNFKTGSRVSLYGF